jgi:SAM-dependent methyltransferase
LGGAKFSRHDDRVAIKIAALITKNGAGVSDGSDVTDRYQNYEAWKDWHGRFIYDARQAELYAGDLREIELRGKRVLELGFGDGGLLAWLRDQGADVLGTEINETFLEAGRAADFEVHPSDLTALLVDYEGRIDCIIAFDLLEHLDVEALIGTFGVMRRLLVPGGRFAAKFPNGQSPFGRHFQHGDITHKSTLSIPKIRQLSAMAGFEIVRAGNSHRARARNPLKWLLQAVRYALRDIISFSVAVIFDTESRHLDGNLTVVLRAGGPAD